jgi:hypothetical protein
MLDRDAWKAIMRVLEKALVEDSLLLSYCVVVCSKY